MIIIFENYEKDNALIRKYTESLKNSKIINNNDLSFIDFLEILNLYKKQTIILIDSWVTANHITIEEKIALEVLYSQQGAITLYNRLSTTEEMDRMMMARKMYMSVITNVSTIQN
jgi:hypothetical protein